MTEFVRPTEFLAIARERRQLLMRSRCEVRRPNAERAWDPDTGTYSDPGYTVVYAGPCHVLSRISNGIKQSYEEHVSAEYSVETYPIALPWDAPMVDNGDSMQITESDDQWIIDRGPRPIGWVRYADSRTHRVVYLLIEDRPRVNDA